MKRKSTLKLMVLLTGFFLSAIIVNGQSPNLLSYQAVVRDAGSQLMTDTEVNVVFTIHSGSTGGPVVYSESHTVMTNSYGMITLQIGSGTTTDDLSTIDWGATTYYLNTVINSNDMGTTQMVSVPYALYAETAGSTPGMWSKNADSLFYTAGNVGIGTERPTSTLSVTGTTPQDSAIFEVKNNNGQTVFAVYNDGVRITIDETAKGPKGGFAIGGFDGTKGVTNYLNVSGDSIRMYIDNSKLQKGPKGGFAIGGFDKAKDANSNYLSVYGVQTLQEAYNTFLGFEAGGDGGGMHNTALGYYAGYNITTGSHDNVFIGDSAGMFITSGYENIMIGRNAGAKSFGGYNNIMIGYRSGSEGWNQYNVMIGDEAGRYSTNGVANVFLGDKAGRGDAAAASNDGYYNTFIGSQSGWKVVGGDNNTFLGGASGFNCTTGNYNVFLGASAGNGNITGSNNVYIGYLTGYSNEGSNNIFIGPSVGADFLNPLTQNYRFMVDCFQPSTPDDAFLTGYMVGAKTFRINASTGIKTAPEAGFDLTVAGNAKATAWSTTSDERLKTGIESIEDPLEKVLELNGVSFEWKDKEKYDNARHIGFLAQEVEDVVPEVVNTGGDYYSVEYSQLTALLVEAIKELKKENDQLKARVDRVEELETMIEDMKALLENQ